MMPKHFLLLKCCIKALQFEVASTISTLLVVFCVALLANLLVIQLDLTKIVYLRCEVTSARTQYVIFALNVLSSIAN